MNSYHLSRGQSRVKLRHEYRMNDLHKLTLHPPDTDFLRSPDCGGKIGQTDLFDVGVSSVECVSL